MKLFIFKLFLWFHDLLLPGLSHDFQRRKTSTSRSTQDERANSGVRFGNLGSRNMGFNQYNYSAAITIWLFNIAMENGPFIDGLPMFTY